MPILVNDKRNLFTLHTKRSTYQMKVDALGTLLHTYYGSRIGETDMGPPDIWEGTLSSWSPSPTRSRAATARFRRSVFDTPASVSASSTLGDRRGRKAERPLVLRRETDKGGTPPPPAVLTKGQSAGPLRRGGISGQPEMKRCGKARGHILLAPGRR